MVVYHLQQWRYLGDWHRACKAFTASAFAACSAWLCQDMDPQFKEK
jgi:hypothetical protein